MAVKVRGLPELRKNLKAFSDKKLINGLARGMFVATEFLKEKSQDQAPVEDGNLVNTAFAAVEKGRNKVTGRVGYTAEYSAAVHESVDEKLRGLPRSSGKGKYWDGGKSKFLEDPVNQNGSKILQLILRASKF